MRRMFSAIACLVTLSAALTVLAGPAAAEDKPEDTRRNEALDKIAAKIKDIKSFSADFVMTMGPDARPEASPKGHILFLLPDKIRMTMPTPLGQGEQTTISDGNVTWVLIPGMGVTARVDMVKVKAALKEAGVPEQGQQHNIANPLAALDPKSVKLTGTEKVQDKECWVFEGRPQAAGMPARMRDSSTMRILVSVDDGLARHMELRDETGNAVMQVTYEKITLNPETDPKTFQHEPPKDARVMDQTDQVIQAVKMFLPKPEAKEKAPEPPKE